MRRAFFIFAILTFATTAAAVRHPPAIQHLIGQGVHIVKRFKAPSGLIGYAARLGGERVMLYATPDGQHVLVGTLLDANGRNLTQRQLHRYLPTLGVWQRLARAAWVAVGAAHPKRIVYVFTDPNCPYCHQFWRASQPYLAHGLQVRNILVGIVAPSSAAKAAAILDADHPAKALRQNERDYNGARVDGESAAGGVAPELAPRAATRAELAANRHLMQTLGFHGTPGIVYRDARGQVHRYAGLPPLTQLPTLLHLPPQPHTAPTTGPNE